MTRGLRELLADLVLGTACPTCRARGGHTGWCPR